jgi:hypothetical protein
MGTRRISVASHLRIVGCLVVGLVMLTGAQAQSLPVLSPSGSIDPPGSPSPGAFPGFIIDVNDGVALAGIWSETLTSTPGEVFAYARDPSGVWQPDGSLTNPAPDPDDGFGGTLAIEGNIAVVKASNPGYHVFRRTRSGWTLVQDIQPNPGEELSGVEFRGRVVAISSGSLSGGPGGVYIYRVQGHQLRYVTTLRASDASNNDGFGHRVTLSRDGHTLVASAVNGADNFTGSVYVFKRRGSKWIQTQKLRPPTEGVLFGDGTAIEGDTLIVGATFENSGHGAAYVFHRIDGRWQLVQHILPPEDPALNVFAFGNSIAIGPSHVGFGAHFSSPGTAFVFESTPSGLSPVAVITGTTFFGEQLFFDDATLLVNSPAEWLVWLYEVAP